VINDRGPFTRGVTLDLSMGAARAIGMRGTQWVCMFWRLFGLGAEKIVSTIDRAKSCWWTRQHHPLSLLPARWRTVYAEALQTLRILGFNARLDIQTALTGDRLSRRRNPSRIRGAFE